MLERRLEKEESWFDQELAFDDMILILDFNIFEVVAQLEFD